jgi:predicted unusual protein kinase regulating ubiquinone biosynthesis (AarF/ABC1/UbiB family)
VPAKSGGKVWALAYKACKGGREGFHHTFDNFNNVPLSAALLGLVYQGRLCSTGERVAIKNQRLRLWDIYDKDLAIMAKIARVINSFGRVGRVGRVEQSSEGIFPDTGARLYREIDYHDEADNAAQFTANFGIGVGGKAVECAAHGLDRRGLLSVAGGMCMPHTYRENKWDISHSRWEISRKG